MLKISKTPLAKMVIMDDMAITLAQIKPNTPTISIQQTTRYEVC